MVPINLFMNYLRDREEHPEDYREIVLPWWVLILGLAGLIGGIVTLCILL